jgi:hypothetical protein
MTYPTRISWIAVATMSSLAVALRAQPVTPPPVATSQPVSQVDPAAIFPPDTIVYAEIASPGEQLERLLKLLADGGIADPMQMLMQKMQPTSQPATGAAQPAMPMPLAMILNPSLINEIKKIEGMASGLTGFDVEQRPNYRSTEPKFLAVVCPGQSDAIRGIAQMLLAMATKTSEMHGSAMVYKLGDGPERRTPYAAVVPRAILVGMPKKMVTDALDRLDKPGSESLATQSRFKDLAGPNRRDAALTVYTDVDALIRAVSNTMTQRDRNDFAKVQQLLGLDALDRACLRYSLTSDGVASELSASLKSGQTCAMFDLIRTPPADRSLLTFVPADALGFLTLAIGDGGERYDRVLSLIKMASSLDKPAKATTRPAVEEGVEKAEKELGVSIRNDLVANVEGIALAMLPPDAAKLSAVGGKAGAAEEAMKMAMASNVLLVVKVKDPQQFDQTLAKLMNAVARKLAEGDDARAVPAEEPVDGGVLRVYAVPGCPVVPVVARLDRTYAFAVDKATVQAALAAHAGTKPNVATGGPCQKALASIPAKASKIVAFRPDLIAALVLRVRIGVGHQDSHGGAATRPAFPPLPAMQPITLYTVEDEQGMTVRGDIHDVPKMIATVMQLHSGGVLEAFADQSRSSSLVDRLAPLGRASSEGVRKAVSIAASEDINNECLSPIDLLLCGEYLLLGGQKERAVAGIEKAIERGGKDRFYYKSLGWAQLCAGHVAEAKQSFQTAVKGMGDWSDKAVIEPNIDGWTAAYFLDLVTQQEYTDRWQKDENHAGFPWFYVGQRMEIEGNKDRAIEAYRKSVDLGKRKGAHYIRNWSAYRLGVLTGTIPAWSAKPSSGSGAK